MHDGHDGRRGQHALQQRYGMVLRDQHHRLAGDGHEGLVTQVTPRFKRGRCIWNVGLMLERVREGHRDTAQ